MAQIQFNAATVDPFGDRTPVQPGEYRVIVKQSNIEVPKNNSGKMISLQMSVIEGEQAGKVIFQNINYLHSNPTAQQIGQSKLSALCHAVGVLNLQDTQQLHGIPLRIQVSVSEDGKYNEVDAYKRDDGQPIVKGVAGPAAGGGAAAPAWAAQGQAPAPQQQAPVQQAPAPQPQQQWTPPAQQQAPAPQQQAPAASPPWQQPQAQQAPQQAPQQMPAAQTPPWQRPS